MFSHPADEQRNGVRMRQVRKAIQKTMHELRLPENHTWSRVVAGEIKEEKRMGNAIFVNSN